MPQILALVVILLIVLVFIAGIYNSLVALKNETKNAWAQIDTQLKRRYDLIPNLIETAKAYMEYEKSTLETVIKARNSAMSVKNDPKVQSNLEGELTGALKNLFALSENYPELKANQNFLALQEELTSTENKISYARVAYNDAVMHYTNKKEMFPTNMVASIFNFQNFDYFQVDENEKEVVKVKFN